MIRKWQAGVRKKRKLNDTIKHVRRAEQSSNSMDNVGAKSSLGAAVAAGVGLYGVVKLNDYLKRRRYRSHLPKVQEPKVEVEEEAWTIIESYISEFPDADVK